MSCCDRCRLDKESLQAEVEDLKESLRLRPALQDPTFSLDASNLGVPVLAGDMRLYSALSSTRRSNELQTTKIQELEERIVQLQAAHGEEIGKLNILNNTHIKAIEGRDANIEKLSAQLKETRDSRANAYGKYKEWVEYSNEQTTKMEALQIEVGKITADAAQKDLAISQQGNEIELKDGITKEKDSEIAEQKAELLARTVEISRLQANVKQMEEEQEKTRAWKNKASGRHEGIVIGLKDAYRDDFDRLMNKQEDLEDANATQAKELAMLHEILYDGSTGETCSAEELKAKLKEAIEELKPTYQGEITIDELIYQVSAFSMRFNEEVRQSYLARESLRELQNYAVVVGDVVTTQHTYDRIQMLENDMDELRDENYRLERDIEDWEDRHSKLVDHYRRERIARKFQIAQLKLINLNLLRPFGRHGLHDPKWTASAADLGEFKEDKSLSGLIFREDFRGRRSLHPPRSSPFVQQSIEIDTGPIPELDRFVRHRLGLNEIPESVEAINVTDHVLGWDDGSPMGSKRPHASRYISSSLGDNVLAKTPETHSVKSKRTMATEEPAEHTSKRLKATAEGSERPAGSGLRETSIPTEDSAVVSLPQEMSVPAEGFTAGSLPRETSIPTEGSADASSLASKREEAEQPEAQPAEHPLVFPGALETAASIHDEATIQTPVPPPQVPAALGGHEVNFLKPCPADIQNDKTWIESGEKWTRQQVPAEVRDHVQSYITDKLEPFETYEGKAKRKWRNACQTNCVRSRIKNLKISWSKKKMVKGYACDNCIKAGTPCMMILVHGMAPTILPRAPELREGLTEQDLLFWVKTRETETASIE